MEKQKVRKFGAIYLLSWLLIPVILFLSQINQGNANAQILPIFKAKDGGGLSDPTGATFEAKFRNMFDILYKDLLYIIGGVAVSFIVYSAFRLVTAQGEDEVINKQKTNLKWGIIGLILISMAPQLDKIFFFSSSEDTNCTFICNTEHILASAGIFNESVFIIIAFIKYVIGIVAVFFIVIAAANLIMFGFNEETYTKSKKSITYSLLALIGINLANLVVNKIFLSISENPTIEPGVQLEPGITEIIGITNFIVTFVGPLAILALIAGGFYYIISMGDDEKMGVAKKIIINSIIGILVIYGAFGFVAAFVSGSIGAEEKIDFTNYFN